MTTRPPSRLYAVVGDPISHSLSPLIHNRWMREAGLDAHYSAIHLQADDAAPGIRLLARDYSGLNITLPHKIAALAAAGEASTDAKRVGAANTLVRNDAGGWSAHNTDIEGFAHALQAAAGNELAGRRVVLIGAGGAARAAVLHIARMGADLAIVNRSQDNAVRLAKDLAPQAKTAGLDQLGALAEDAAIVVNSASLGHAGANLPTLPPGRGRPFLDMSYGKAAETVLNQARLAGWAPHDGLRMLVGQAAAAFRIWFGLSPDTDGALDACRAAVAARS
ncbi:MAG TPA: shikimate dehydrogenase [Hyphomonadaceae bacterium]|nr:shikimate dehydrogenase [Hyphomonadaceae bacterium]